MALGIQELAKAITASLEEFNRAFLQAQVNAVAEPAERKSVFGLAPNETREAAIAKALEHASAGGWLESVVTILVGAGLESGEISADRATDKTGAPLQAMLDLAKSLDHPDLFYKRMAAAMRWTALVYVDGKAEGSGVLVGPHLVLTAWHVVQGLFELKGGKWSPRNIEPPGVGQAPRLEVEFDNCIMLAGTAMAPRQSFRVQAAAGTNWCVASSAPHMEELQKKLPNNLADLEGWWDYAVLRLRKAPGMERRWADIRAEHVVPADDSKIVLMQHPGGNPMRFGDHVIPKVHPQFRPSIPTLRFVHLANTQPGSSGGPCFDRQFALFGIHQGVWPHPSPGHPYPISNRGVPLVQIAKHIARTIDKLPSPSHGEHPVFHLGPAKAYAPVIGCDAFVSRLWDMASGGAKRILLIESAPRKTGKTFRTEVVAAALPDNGHLKVVIDMTPKRSARELADAICEAAGVAPPMFEEPEKFGSGAGTWVKDDVGPKLVSVLGTARADRLAWLVFQNLDKAKLEGFAAKDLLLAIVGYAADTPWLRVVLDGYEDDLPGRVQLEMETETAKLPNKAEIANYLRLCVARHIAPQDLGIEAVASAVHERVQEATREERLEVLVYRVKRALKLYFELVDVHVPEEEPA